MHPHIDASLSRNSAGSQTSTCIVRLRVNSRLLSSGKNCGTGKLGACQASMTCPETTDTPRAFTTGKSRCQQRLFACYRIMRVNSPEILANRGTSRVMNLLIDVRTETNLNYLMCYRTVKLHGISQTVSALSNYRLTVVRE